MIEFNCPGLEHSKRTKGRLRCLPEREKGQLYCSADFPRSCGETRSGGNELTRSSLGYLGS